MRRSVATSFSILGLACGDAGSQGPASDTYELTSECTAVPRSVLDATPEELATALAKEGYENRERRVDLVFAASCARAVACGSATNEAACIADQRARYQSFIGPNGRHVPCLDAYLDALGCSAALDCCDTEACASLRANVGLTCDAPPPITNLGDSCDPTLHDPPTKGPVPDAAINPGGRGTNWALVPDYVTVAGPDPDVTPGYVRKCEIHGREGSIPVWDESLTQIVGHMVPGRGFVPN